MDIYRYQPGICLSELRPGVVFEVEDARFVFKGDLGDGALNIVSARTGELHRIRDEQTGIVNIATNEWIQTAIADGTFRIVADADGPIVPLKAPKGELNRSEALEIDPMAEARHKLLLRLAEEGICRNAPKLGSDVTKIWTEELAQFGDKPATSTVRSWMGRTDVELPSIFDLVSMSGRVPRARRLDPAVVEILEKRARWYWDDRGRKVRDAIAAVHVDIRELNRERRESGLPTVRSVSRETVRREIRRVECREFWVSKFGEQAAKRHWDASGRSLVAKRALEVVLIDDTVLDTVACIDAKRRLPANRPYICVILDVATRCVVGWVLSFSPPSTHTAAECVRRAARDKLGLRPDWVERYPVLRQIGGKPNKIICDNGKNYVAPAFQDAMADAGIAIQFAPIRSPKSKAMLERFFWTLKTWLLEKLPGHTLDPKEMRELGYDPEKHAVLLVEELEQLIEEFINVYHISIHSGINTQPAAAWLRSIEAHGRQTLDPRKLSKLTWITVHDRRLTRNGIRFNRLLYRDADTVNRLLAANAPGAPMGSRIKGSASCHVKIKYNPDNLGSILVWDRSTSSYVELICADQSYASGLTMHQHDQAAAWAQRRNLEFNSEDERIEALHSLNEFIEQTIPEMTARQRRAAARMLGGAVSEEIPTGVAIAYADARHDGLAPVLEHDAAADTRVDAEDRLSRPDSGKQKKDSHDTDLREAPDDAVVDHVIGLWTSPADDDEAYEEDYA